MPKYPKELFAASPKWGVTPGAHVAHVIDPSANTSYTEITQAQRGEDHFAQYAADRQVGKVTQAEVYTNEGDNKTAETFLALAGKASRYYSAPDCPAEYKEVLLSMKKYITAGGRREQQAALKEYKAKAGKLYRSLAEENARLDDGIAHISPAKYNLNDRIKAELEDMTRGVMEITESALEVPADYSYSKKDIKEPDNTIVGKFGIWTSSDDELFPHAPSPNDIKQGYGIHDCYVLSALTQLAASSPEKIRECMKDNRDGTVTVRFYDFDKKPVYVTVNKTVNRLAGKGDVYASSSLWVQMMEKAYVKYCHEQRGAAHNFSSIDYGGTDDFMNAFDGEKNYSGFAYAFGFAYPRSGDLYDYDANGMPVHKNDGKYLPHEEDLYNFLHSHVNDAKEVFTVGNSGMRKNNAKFSLDHGIRLHHAYTVMGVFEKDGKKYVQLRDPYALFRSRYDENGELVKDSAMLAGTFKAGLSNMGTFNLELKDFQRNFDNFIGMPMEAFDEFQKMRENWIDYENPENAPAEPEDELEEFEIGGDEPEAVAHAEVKEASEAEAPAEANEAPEVNSLEDAELEAQPLDPIHQILREPGGFDQVAEVVTYLKNDLDSTAMFFSYKNTDRFVKMRDKLNETYGMVIKEKAKEEYALKALDGIGDSLKELSELAADYADAKYKSIQNDIAKGKEPSLRAVHRMAAAVSLIGVGRGELQIARSEEGFAESMTMVREDLARRVENLEKQPDSPEKLKQLSSLNKAGEVLDQYISKHPEIREQTQRVKQQSQPAKKSPAAGKKVEAPVKLGEDSGFEIY